MFVRRPAHNYVTAIYKDDTAEHLWHGYPDECFAVGSLADSIVAQVLYGGWGTQPPVTTVKMALVIDFCSTRESEAEASLAHGWNGSWEFPMGITNTVHSRIETNAQNALFERHLTLIGTAITCDDFYHSVGERLLDVHSCPDHKHCGVCKGRLPRALADVFQLLSAGMSLSTIHLFAKWQPSNHLSEILKADGIEVVHHDLSEIPTDDLEANRSYSIWDGTEMQAHEFRDAIWAPAWKREAAKLAS
jgi:hypothetical protein